MSRRSVLLVGWLSVSLAGCAVLAGKGQSWSSPDKAVEVRFHPGAKLEGTEPSQVSNYSFHDRATGRQVATVPSMIGRDREILRQAVRFSPSGKTILIYEDVTDASPEYQYLLLTRSGSAFTFRRLQMPQRHPIPDAVWTNWPDIFSLTDAAVEVSYWKDPIPVWLRLQDIPSRDL